MSNPSMYRDSTEIVVPLVVLDPYVDELKSRFTVTVFEEEDTARIIGSPVVINDVAQYLSRQGVNLP